MATTTEAAIRDRMITVISGLTPVSLADRFAEYRNEGDGDFVTWASKNPDAAWRRFQVRDNGDDTLPLVSNDSMDEHLVTFVILVAYTQSSRAGAKNALDRDRVMKEDQHAFERSIGLGGAANFATPNPDASLRSSKTKRVILKGVDFLQITQTMGFYLA